MARIDLSKHNGGYWGYLNDDVRETISELFEAIQVNDHTPPIMSISTGGVSILGGLEMLGNTILTGAVNAADDITAAASGVPINGIYHTNGTLKIRQS